MKWFRFHVNAIDNLKIQRLPADLFKAWVNFMCVACENQGYLPDPDSMAFRMRIPAKRTIEIREKLVSAALVDQEGDRFKMHDWSHWQFQSDVSTERVRQFRKRFTKHIDSVSENDSCNVSGTDISSVLFCSGSGKEKKDTPLDEAIRSAATEMHDRHPAKRRCGIKEVESRIRAIVRRLPNAEKIPKVQKINANHAAWCQTEGWLKEDGEYAKGLDNWLAPTKGRYEEPAPLSIEQKRTSENPGLLLNEAGFPMQIMR